MIGLLPSRPQLGNYAKFALSFNLVRLTEKMTDGDADLFLREKH